MTPHKPVQIILIDDHVHIHDIVMALLREADDIQLIGQGSDGEEAIRMCRDLHPDMVLIDVVMPGLGGIEATRVIHGEFPEIRVLVLSSFEDQGSILGMLEAGACGYVLKSELVHDLLHTIRAAYRGSAVFSACVAEQLFSLSRTQNTQGFDLTDREMEVLRMMGRGMNNPQIAYDLAISQSTVKFHVNNILAKMGVETRSEALVLAAKNSLI